MPRWTMGRSATVADSRPSVSVIRMSGANSDTYRDIQADARGRPWPSSVWRKMLADPRCGGTTANVSGLTVGFLLYSVAKEDDGIRIARLLEFSVMRGMQRKGIGSALFDSFINSPLVSFNKSLFVKEYELTIECHEENLPFQLFLRSRGVPVIGVNRKVMSDGRDSYTFRAKRRGISGANG